MPKGYSEICSVSVKALQVPEDQILEIKTLLEGNFVQFDGHYNRPEMLEKRELEAHCQQRLKGVCKEMVLVGFTQSYRKKRF